MNSRWKFCRVLLLGGIVLLCPPAAGAQEQLSNAIIVRNFNIVAFGNEYTLKRYEFIRKWKRPIIARLDGNPPPDFEDFVVEHFRTLAGITGHPARLAYSARMRREKRIEKGLTGKSFNMFLLFYPMDKLTTVLRGQVGNLMDPSLERLKAGQSTCEAQLFKKGNEIKSAVVLFPAYDQRDTLRACVVEELTQVMGLANDSNAVSPSIFNDASRYFELTKHDELLLRILYDKRMAIGTPRKEAMVLAHQILFEIRP